MGKIRKSLCLFIVSSFLIGIFAGCAGNNRDITTSGSATTATSNETTSNPSKVPTDPNFFADFEPITDEKIQEIERASIECKIGMYDRIYLFIPENINDIRWDSPYARYYGTFNDYQIIYCPYLPNTTVVTAQQIRIADSIFANENQYSIYAYKDGVFYSLIEDDDYISNSEVIKRHNYFEELALHNVVNWEDDAIVFIKIDDNHIEGKILRKEMML